ncbi:MAG: DUF86 domain-containing protein [Bacteroidia bacterium]|nr:DUF86 domain-containing protein [Bacteroidia bacterium]
MTDIDRKYLFDILTAIELIESFTKSVVSYNEYLLDIKTRSAVERQLGIIGEAVNKYDLENQSLTLIHARKIVGFRNRLIHAYDSIDQSIIWAIILNHLPLLKKEVEQKLGN